MSGRASRLLAGAAAIALALAPAVADARLGGGGSVGSRGSNTYSAPPSTRTAPNMTQPMERSITPYQAPRPNAAPGPMPGQMAPARSGGFMSGLAGGLIGAGIGSMIFGGGGGFFGHGLGFGGFLGFLLQIFLVVMIGRLLWRWFSNRQPAVAGGPGAGMFARAMNPGANPGMAPGAPPPGMGNAGGMARGGPPPVAVSPQDFREFEQLLIATQAAWSARDLNALRGMVTPEMVSYFGEQLADHASRGVVNTVTDVRLDSGDLSQAWAEGGREYATVAMRFSMIDVTRDGSGRVVDGSPTERTSATEVWTFVRAQGGHWILSAIQQAR